MLDKEYCFRCFYCEYKICGTLNGVYKSAGSDLLCPECGRHLSRDYKAERSNFILKGDGFYSNDHRATQKDKGSF